MKPKIFSVCLTLVITALFGLTALGVPKYTDKTTALALAKVLDNGRYGQYTISSAYVQNDNRNDHYISVILSDGSSHKWYIDEIYQWSRDDKLKLNKNRVLLFLDLSESSFVVLDKNKFHRRALNADVFAKIFRAGDPLWGKKFHFRIKTFSLISPQETAFGRDKTGSKFRYLIDLHNGMREELTYEGAYKSIENGRFLKEGASKVPVFGKAYHVTEIKKHLKKTNEGKFSQFGVEIMFVQPILLKSDQFPYEIYERKRYDRRTRKSKKEFVLDITIPNSEKRYEVRSIPNLEYLQNIKIVKDPKFPKRLLLRTVFNPDFMDIPPVVHKSAENAMYVTFFNKVDQTVLNREMMLEAKKLMKAQRESIRKIMIPKVTKRDSDYNRKFVSALEIKKQSRMIREKLPQINKLLTGIEEFEAAAMHAKTDDELFKALAQRNELRKHVIVLSIGHVNDRLAKEDFSPDESQKLISLLDRAESFTRNQKMLMDIGKLRESLIAHQR
ncbi:MAG: hypothetical protein GY866_10340 [Proteobacteria bacterium]|nr:hypothetical protein [Pseudomonadota bacterium]